jgi:glycerol-1-phosphate dehydrogenase [NAD(P)+]
MQIKIPTLLRIKPGAIDRLGKYLAQHNYHQIALFWGEGLPDVFKPQVEVALRSSQVSILYEDICLSSQVEEIFQQSLQLTKIQPQAIVVIGGGKATDFCKYMAFVNKLPLFCLPTVISNDSFCSPLASLLVQNQKHSFKTQLPDAVIIDTKIIQQAPTKFFFSGIGDLLSKYTAIYDWKLSFKKTGEYVDDFAVMISENALESCLNYPEKNLADLNYIKTVASSLLLSGLAMEVAGSSRPASGSEHLISHAYDQIAQLPSLHGLQVGVASLAISFLQETTHQKVKQAILETGFYDFMKQNPLNKADFLKAINLAPSMKQNFYTILSEANNINRLQNFVEQDSLIAEMLV